MTPNIQVVLIELLFHMIIDTACETKMRTVVKVTPFKLYELNLNLYKRLLTKRKDPNPREIMYHSFCKLKQNEPIMVAKKAHIPAIIGWIRFLK